MVVYRGKNKLTFKFQEAVEKVRILFINLLYFYLLLIKPKRTVKSFNETKKILLINTGDLGDNIIGFRFINELFQSSIYLVYVLTKYQYRGLYKNFNHGLIVIPWNKIKYKYNPFYKIKLLSIIRNLNLDIVFNITPERGVLNEELVLCSGGNELWKVNKKDHFIINPLKKKLDKKYSHNFSCGGINEYTILENLSGIMRLKNKPNNHILPKTYRQRKNICIAPFSSDIERNWDQGNYQILINEFSKQHNVIILGAYQSSDLVDFKNRNGFNFIGKTGFRNLFQKLQDTDLFIGNDSGLTHLALYLNVPLIAIIGGGMYQRFFPFNEGKNSRYLYHQMDCFGCMWKCRYIQRYCITKVRTDEVIKNAYGILCTK